MRGCVPTEGTHKAQKKEKEETMEQKEKDPKRHDCLYWLPTLTKGVCSCLRGEDGSAMLANAHEIPEDACRECPNYKYRYIEFPLTINGIETEPIKIWNRGEAGTLCSVRMAGEEAGKTYLGMYLGELPWMLHTSFTEETGVLETSTVTNPGIWVFSLKRIVYGAECWWRRVKDPSKIRDITDEDIDGQWYVQMAKALAMKEEKEEKE